MSRLQSACAAYPQMLVCVEEVDVLVRTKLFCTVNAARRRAKAGRRPGRDEEEAVRSPRCRRDLISILGRLMDYGRVEYRQ